MEEIKDIHTKSLEWGCVANLIDKIGEIENKMDGYWDELINMVADMITEEGNEEDTAKIFFNIYQYCFRLYYCVPTQLRRRLIKSQKQLLQERRSIG